MEKSTLYKTKQTLQKEINALRREMIMTGMTKGLSSKKTVEVSQKLDHILNQYELIS
ncbi:aspartyl-phosphate phosphatase Spo0E family protein [Siminovitchia sediminis]|uniref:Aspartyl-phosphate phosphatase Spo0E family protein n=1 Tax=Siminovitchia sediminis TaxID=1274353 RepID=A0ABW4KEC9_9BACI